MILRCVHKYDFDCEPSAPLTQDNFLNTNFLITFPPLKEYMGTEKTLLSAEGALEVKLLVRSLNSSDPDTAFFKRQNCFDINEENETLIEVTYITATLEGVKETFRFHVPLSLDGIADRPLSLWFNGTWLRVVSNNEMIDESSGIGDIVSPTSVTCMDGIEICRVNSCTVSYEKREDPTNIGVYFPHGYNTHVGDVMTFSHDGVYHIMFLIDRRHHSGRNGRGAHYVAHLTTKDLITWEEQPHIAEIEFPYETFGTGTMFFRDGKYYMSYGIHTYRHPSGTFVFPDYNEEIQSYNPKTFDEILSQGAMPIGATLSVSDDGINFKKTGILYHAAQNPSVYTKKDGNLILYAGYGAEGIYESDNAFGPYKNTGTKLTFCGPDTALECSSECPCYFYMGDYSYLVVGFSGYFRTLSPDSEEMVDAIKLGENIYDGLCVPMVSTLNGRTFIAGWIAHDVGWGGAMLQRELFQENGGKLGMKWIPELYPEKIGENLFQNDEIDVESRKSYIFEGKAVADENGIFAVTLGSGSSYAQLKIDINAKKAQLTSMTDKNTVADNILTYYEKRLSGGDFKSKCKPSIDFAIPDVDLQKEFGIKMVFRFAPKMRTTIGDIEIDGKRTMILAKPNLFVDTFKIAAGEVIDGSLYKITE